MFDWKYAANVQIQVNKSGFLCYAFANCLMNELPWTMYTTMIKLNTDREKWDFAMKVRKYAREQQYLSMQERKREENFSEKAVTLSRGFNLFSFVNKK